MRNIILAAILFQPLYGETAALIEDRRIAGGEEVDPILYPFVVRVYADGTPSNYCTGTLVSDEWVLTAAHCVDGRDAGQSILGYCGSDVSVLHAGVTRTACEMAIHDLYDPFTPENRTYDLALLRIDPFTGRSHRPVRLGQSGAPPEVETETWTAGVTAGYSTPVIKVAQWPVIACPDDYPVGLVCAQGSRGVIVEEGDSGGPMLVQQDGEWRQVGTTLAVNDDTNIVSYADLSTHAQWILSRTGITPTEPNIVVSLGRSGYTVTLVPTAGGGFTLNGEDFSGGEITAPDGSTYRLALADGEWTATLVSSTQDSSDDACPVAVPPTLVLEWENGQWSVRVEQSP